jgi:glyoxylase I family protein
MAAGAPPIQHFEHWTLVTADLEASKRFYTEVLGGRLREGPGPAGVDLAGTLIDLFPTGGRNRQEPRGGVGYHHAYVIRLEDFDPWVEHIKLHEAPMRLTTHGMGRMSIYVEDPDGHHVELTVPFEDEEVGRREIEKRGLLRERPRGE